MNIFAIYRYDSIIAFKIIPISNWEDKLIPEALSSGFLPTWIRNTTYYQIVCISTTFRIRFVLSVYECI